VPDRGTCTETAVAASLTLSLQQFIKLAYPPGLSMSTQALNGAFTIEDCRGSPAFCRSVSGPDPASPGIAQNCLHAYDFHLPVGAPKR